MTSKFSWISFIPFTVAAVFFKLAQFAMPDGSILGLNDTALDYMAIGCAGVVFLITLILCIADHKISQYYQPHRNIPAAVFALLLAFLCAADGANSIYLALSSGEVEALPMIESALLLLSSVVFIVYGLTHAFVNRDSKNFALFNLMPALLCAIRLVRCFVSFTTISIRMADVTLLFCYIFATLFFFNLAVAISLTEAKHAVKSCFIFGFPAATMLFAYSIHAFASSFNTQDIIANIGMTELLMMALYILSFMIEMTLFIKDRDHVVIKTGEEEEAPAEENTENSDNYILSSEESDSDSESDNGYLRTSDISDYLVDVSEKPASSDDVIVNQSDSEGYITEASQPHKGQTPVIMPEQETLAEEQADADYSGRLDEIDKLILELTEGYKD